MVNANYFDGKNARQQAVTLHIANGQLEIRGEDPIREVPLTGVRISAKLGSSPRLLHFADGGHCEVSDHAGFEALLQEAGLRPQSFLSRMENSWRHALTATVLTIIVGIASFHWGLPWVAKVAATRVPASVVLSIDTQFLSTIDQGMVQPSKLSKERQQALAQRFDGLKNANGSPPHRLEFRDSKAIGANAFALPGGTIIVTDQLVALAGNDEEVLAVLAHELGHVSERHPLRQLLQSSVVGLAMTWYVGDVSSLLAAAPTVLLETSYSRDFERRADRYSADMLRSNGIAPSHLADMLEKLEKSHRGKGEKETGEQYMRIFRFLSSHPDTAERIRDLRDDGSR